MGSNEKNSGPRAAAEAAFAAEVHSVFSRVEVLIARAKELGIARHGFQAGGPHETELSRDVAAALFVAWTALQATMAFVQYGGDMWPEFRAQMRGARNLLRGGRPDGAPSADRSMAVAMASQGIHMAIGVGFLGRSEDDAVFHVRSSYADLFGSVFLEAPNEASLRAHLSPGSRAGRALAALRGGAMKHDDFYRELQLAAVALAAEVLWAGRQAAGVPPWPESVFRFPMDARDTSRPKLLARLLKAEGDKRRAAAKRAARGGSDSL